MHHAHSDHMHTHAQSFRARCNHCTRTRTVEWNSIGIDLYVLRSTLGDQRRSRGLRASYICAHSYPPTSQGRSPEDRYRALGCGKRSFRAAGFPDAHSDSQEGTSIRLEGKIIALAPALDSWNVKHKGGEVGRGRIGPGLEDARNALQAPSFACTLASAKWFPAYLVIERSGPGLASTRHAPPT